MLGTDVFIVDHKEQGVTYAVCHKTGNKIVFNENDEVLSYTSSGGKNIGKHKYTVSHAIGDQRKVVLCWADDLDLVFCQYLIDELCANLISRLGDQLAYDEHRAVSRHVSNDIRSLSYVRSVRELVKEEFDKSMTEGGRNQ